MPMDLSKQKRDDLTAKIRALRGHISAEPQDEDTGRLLTYLAELEKEVNGRKYGLVFEEHREKIDEVLATHAPVLTEQADLMLDNGGQMNFLIEGDNLAALKLLEKTHRGRVDLIYIDPPYNRGKTDFVYDDDYVASEDTFKHSKWMSFMKPRMEAAKHLLSEAGLVFISIDDNEVAALKLLCDEVFGAGCFINIFVWQRNSSEKTERGKFTVNTEYVLLYAKSAKYALSPAYKPLADASQKLFKFDDHDGRGKYQTVSLQKPRDPGPETTYDYVDNTGKVWPCPPKGWRMRYEKIKALENDGRLVLSGRSLRVKDYWNERENAGKRVDTLWNDLPQNTAGSHELDAIMGRANTFDNPKPTELIKRCLEIGGKNACVLDFFAGSGTTGHAVMKLNAEDGGHRRFILCNNNENGICREVAYERIRRVIEKEKYAAGLKYYRIDYVPTGQRLYYEYADELLAHVRELVELENGIDFTGNGETAIVLTDETLAGFIAQGEVLDRCRALYLGHDVLPSGEQEELLRARGVAVHIVPDYYYREEV